MLEKKLFLPGIFPKKTRKIWKIGKNPIYFPRFFQKISLQKIIYCVLFCNICITINVKHMYVL